MNAKSKWLQFVVAVNVSDVIWSSGFIFSPFYPMFRATLHTVWILRIFLTVSLSTTNPPEADPDLELRSPQYFFACPAGFYSFCDLFLPKIRGGGRPPGPLP